VIRVFFDEVVSPPFNEGTLRLQILNEARKIAREIRRDFERTVSTWETKPVFSVDLGFSKDLLSVDVVTDDENYRRVSEGVEGTPRVARGFEITSQITPTTRAARPFRVPSSRGASALTLFPYIPKTTPGDIDAHAGGRVEGTPPIFRRYALNAGKIEARNFDLLIQEKWLALWPDRFQQALDNAAAKSGFAF
jgi:hypothetical protein